MAYSRIIINNELVMDLTKINATPEDVVMGKAYMDNLGHHRQGTLQVPSFSDDITKYICEVQRSTKTYQLNHETLLTLRASALQSAFGLTSFNCPNCSRFSSYALANCTNLTTVLCDSLSAIQSNALLNCSALTYISVPKVSNIGLYAFQNCINLSFIDLPQLTVLWNRAFNRCINLGTIKCGSGVSNTTKLVGINAEAFHTASNLSSVYLYYSGGTSNILPLMNVNAFYGTKLSSQSATGYIYVPQEMISYYSSATNWNVYDGLGRIKPIEATFNLYIEENGEQNSLCTVSSCENGMPWSIWVENELYKNVSELTSYTFTVDIQPDLSGVSHKVIMAHITDTDQQYLLYVKYTTVSGDTYTDICYVSDYLWGTNGMAHFECLAHPDRERDSIIQNYQFILMPV